MKGVFCFVFPPLQISLIHNVSTRNKDSLRLVHDFFFCHWIRLSDPICVAIILTLCFPTIHLCPASPRVGSQQKRPDFPDPGHLEQLIWRDLARPRSSSEGRGPGCVTPGDITILAVHGSFRTVIRLYRHSISFCLRRFDQGCKDLRQRRSTTMMWHFRGESLYFI